MTEEAPSRLRDAVESASAVLSIVQRILLVAVAIILAASALLLFLQVIDRTILRGGQNWIEEYARLSLIWMTFLGAAALMREGRHLAVDYFVEKLPARVRLGFAIATHALIIALLTVLLTQASAVWASSAVLLSPSLGIPRSVLALAALISYVITVVFCLESIVRLSLDMDPVRTLMPSDDPDPIEPEFASPASNDAAR